MTERARVPCPHCGYGTDSRMGIAPTGSRAAKEQKRAKPGDISICIRCAGLAIFTAGMGQRKMIYLEELGLDAETKALVATARANVRIVNRSGA